MSKIFDIAFSLESPRPSGEGLSAAEIRTAILKRLAALGDEELLAAVGTPFDSCEVAGKQTPPVIPMPDHAKLPWIAITNSNLEFDHTIRSVDGGVAHANARNAVFIVRACNAHAALLLACEELFWLLTNWRRLPKSYDLQGAFTRANTAIAAARRR